MASNCRVFKGCRALFAASKAATPTPKSSPAAGKKSAAAPASKPSRTSASPSPKSSPAAVAAASVTKKTRVTGFSKVMPISPALRNFLGVPESARAEALKKTWDYIKLHNLQNPKDKKEILCDATLKNLFEGKEKVGILEVSKLLNPHFVKN